MNFSAGTKGFCGSCGEHMFTLACDVGFGTLVSESIFDRSAGQAPFHNGDPIICKSCHSPWGYPFSCGLKSPLAVDVVLHCPGKVYEGRGPEKSGLT